MPSRSRSESDHDTDDATPAAQAAAGAALHQPESGQSQGFLAGFQVPLPGIGNVDPLRLLWLGGLAALATIEIIEWPVALTLGAGSFIAERLARQEAREDLRKDLAELRS
jgi:hydrogenase/urease accessory protein HupE